jgi:hypothetical protein
MGGARWRQPLPLWQRWEHACDYLGEDLASGIVWVLQEMTAAGWSDPTIAATVRRDLQGWYDLLTRLAEEAGQRFGGLGPFSPEEVASLIGHAFVGTEALALLGLDNPRVPGRQALRKFGTLIRQHESGEV